MRFWMKSSLTTLYLAGSLGMIAIAPSALAHHSFAMYDRTKTVTLEGIVKKWTFANPHSQLLLVVTEDGAPNEYDIEGASVNTLIRIGWGPTVFKPGDKVTVLMNPVRDGSKAGAFIRATLPDGRTLSAGQTPI
jgi:hypothetical protein